MDTETPPAPTAAKVLTDPRHQPAIERWAHLVYDYSVLLAEDAARDRLEDLPLAA